MYMDSKINIIKLPITDKFLRQKRLIQDRGELALIEDGMSIQHLGYFSLLAGKGYRGGHYHKIKTEHFYVISGHLLVELLDVETNESDQVELKAGTKASILPFLAHRFQAIHDSQVIEYYDGFFEAADDLPYNFDS